MTLQWTVIPPAISAWLICPHLTDRALEQRRLPPHFELTPARATHNTMRGESGPAGGGRGKVGAVPARRDGGRRSLWPPQVIQTREGGRGNRQHSCGVMNSWKTAKSKICSCELRSKISFSFFPQRSVSRQQHRCCHRALEIRVYLFIYLFWLAQCIPTRCKAQACSWCDAASGRCTILEEEFTGSTSWSNGHCNIKQDVKLYYSIDAGYRPKRRLTAITCLSKLQKKIKNPCSWLKTHRFGKKAANRWRRGNS